MSHQITIFNRDVLKISLEDSKIENISRNNNSAKVLSLIENKKQATVRGEVLTPDLTLFSMAKELSCYGENVEWEFLPNRLGTLQETGKKHWFSELGLNEIKELAFKIDQSCKKKFPDFSFQVQLAKENTEFRIQNSQEVDCSRVHDDFSLSIRALNANENEIFEWFGSPSQAPSSQDEIEKFLLEFFEELAVASRSVHLSSCELPFIFTPLCLQNGVLSPFEAAISCEAQYTKTSQLADKVGSQIFDQALSFKDSCKITRFDDNGLETGAKTWIENGILKDLPVLLSYSKKLNKLPSACNFPSGYFANLSLEGGNHSLHDMISSLEKGVVLLHSFDLFQGDVSSGKLSGSLSMALLVENGKMVGRLKGNTFAFDFYKTMKSDIQAISREKQIFGTNFTQSYPWLLTKPLKLA